MNPVNRQYVERADLVGQRGLIGIWQLSGLQDVDVSGSRNRGSSGIRPFHIILDTNDSDCIISLFRNVRQRR